VATWVSNKTGRSVAVTIGILTAAKRVTTRIVAGNFPIVSTPGSAIPVNRDNSPNQSFVSGSMASADWDSSTAVVSETLSQAIDATPPMMVTTFLTA
jgi:hypothetical protein